MTLKENDIYMKPPFFNDEHLKTLHKHFKSEIWIVGQMKFSIHQK
jgi:hypothetical protein